MVMDPRVYLTGNHHLHFTGERDLANFLAVFFLDWFCKRTFGNNWHGFLKAGCPAYQSPSQQCQSTEKK